MNRGRTLPVREEDIGGVDAPSAPFDVEGSLVVCAARVRAHRERFRKVQTAQPLKTHDQSGITRKSDNLVEHTASLLGVVNRLVIVDQPCGAPLKNQPKDGGNEQSERGKREHERHRAPSWLQYNQAQLR